MESIISSIIGIVFIIIGISNTKGNISLMHSYHRKRVSEENRLPFGRLVGIGMIIIGAALIFSAIFSFMATVLQYAVFEVLINAALIVGFVIGIGFIFYAMFKYNKGIF